MAAAAAVLRGPLQRARKDHARAAAATTAAACGGGNGGGLRVALRVAVSSGGGQWRRAAAAVPLCERVEAEGEAQQRRQERRRVRPPTAAAAAAALERLPAERAQPRQRGSPQRLWFHRDLGALPTNLGARSRMGGDEPKR